MPKSSKVVLTVTIPTWSVTVAADAGGLEPGEEMEKTAFLLHSAVMALQDAWAVSMEEFSDTLSDFPTEMNKEDESDFTYG